LDNVSKQDALSKLPEWIEDIGKDNISNEELKVLEESSYCAKHEYPNTDTFRIKSLTFDIKSEEWSVQIFTDDGMGMEIKCWESKGEFVSQLQSEF